jgi:ribosomal RNA-processing protein 12
MIPPTAMHVILSVIPEAVLGTKEPSEKTRSAAFDVIVAMGRKMSEGGVVKRDMVDGMDEDGASGEGLFIPRVPPLSPTKFIAQLSLVSKSI